MVRGSELDLRTAIILLHPAEGLQWITGLAPFVRVPELRVAVVGAGTVQQRVFVVNEFVHGAQKDAVLPRAAEQHRQTLAVARRPHTVEASRHPPVSHDLRRPTVVSDARALQQRKDRRAGGRGGPYREQLAGDEGEQVRLRRHREPDPVLRLHLEALHAVLHDGRHDAVVAVRLQGHARLRVRRGPVARQPDAVDERVQMRADVLLPDAEALQDHLLHRALQL